MGPSLFHILGVERSATAEDIRAAWRKLAKEHHPDLAARKGWTAEQARAHEKTYREANAAYTVLSDPAQRRAYEVELDAIRTRFTAQKQARPAKSTPTSRYDPPPGTPFRRKFSGFRVEEASREVQRQIATLEKSRRIEADRAAHLARKREYEDMVRRFTAELLAEIMLAQLEDLPD